MSERARIAPALLTLALALGAPLARAAEPRAEAGDAEALLAAADRVRDAWNEATLTLEVTTSRPDGPPVTAKLEVDVKGLEKARVRFTGKDEGKMLVLNGKEAWLILPGTRNPIHVPKSHRLAGGFAAGDIARTRFTEDYDAVVEREDDTLPSGPAAVLRLMAKKGKSPSYPIVRLWVDRKEKLYRKAVFLLASGRTAKETSFDAYRRFHGVLALARMTITDALRPGTTAVTYVDYEKRTFPDAIFTPQGARAQL